MGYGKKKKYQPKPFEHSPIYKGRCASANIYESMLMSDAWAELTKGQRLLYLYCKYQLYGQRKDDKRGLDEKYRKDPEYFTMNKSKWCDLYGLYSANNYAGFQKDMTKLIECGFIDLVYSGYSHRVKSLYRLSSRWILYGTPDYAPPKVMPHKDDETNE